MRSSTTRRKHAAFTLIELLVVVLILAILMAVALPLYLSAISNAQRRTCRTNLHTIATAVEAARVHNRSGDYSAYMGAVTTAKLPDLFTVPLCPTNGTYSVINGSSGDATTYKVQCSVASHGTFEPGVDNS